MLGMVARVRGCEFPIPPFRTECWIIRNSRCIGCFRATLLNCPFMSTRSAGFLNPRIVAFVLQTEQHEGLLRVAGVVGS